MNGKVTSLNNWTIIAYTIQKLNINWKWIKFKDWYLGYKSKNNKSYFDYLTILPRQLWKIWGRKMPREKKECFPEYYEIWLYVLYIMHYPWLCTFLWEFSLDEERNRMSSLEGEEQMRKIKP